MPTVSVLMPAYNVALYIEEAIDSILSQTFTDYEFLICDDASTDNTLGIASSYSDSRIRILKNEKNQGIANSRNRLLKEAKGKYLAWLDADDVAYKDRLMEQVNFMEKNSNIYILATYVHFDYIASGNMEEYTPFAISPEEVIFYLLFRNCVATSSVMMRNSIEYNYFENFSPAEDYECWLRIAQKYPITLIPKFLVKIKIYANSTSHRQRERQLSSVKLLAKRQLEYYDLASENNIEAVYSLMSQTYRVLEWTERKKAIRKILDFFKVILSWPERKEYFQIEKPERIINSFIEEMIPFLSYRQRIRAYSIYYVQKKWRMIVPTLFVCIEALFAFLYFRFLPALRKKVLRSQNAKLFIT